MQYYIVKENRSAGPFNRDELLVNGLTSTTLVWREGLQGWVAAMTLPELADLLAEESAFGTYAQNDAAQVPPEVPRQPQQPPYYQQRPNPVAPRPTNWLVPAIVATVVGFMFSCVGGILGIIAIVYSNKANNAFAIGNEMEGKNANQTAQILTIIAYCLAGLGILIAIKAFFMGVTALTWM